MFLMDCEIEFALKFLCADATPGLVGNACYWSICASYVAKRIEMVSFCISMPCSRLFIFSLVCFLYKSNCIFRLVSSCFSKLSLYGWFFCCIKLCLYELAPLTIMVGCLSSLASYGVCFSFFPRLSLPRSTGDGLLLSLNCIIEAEASPKRWFEL